MFSRLAVRARYGISSLAAHARHGISSWASGAILIALISAGAAAASPIPAGDGAQSVSLAGTTLSISTYRPAGCTPRLVMLVFHGIRRNAASYRTYARPLADAGCAVVVAPLFDKARFPRDRYEYGGVAAAPGGRTIDLIPPLADWAKEAAGNPTLPLVLLGHSAGSQFLDRVAALVPTGAVRIIVANPSTWMLPTADIASPFGFGGLGTAAETEPMIRAYLALPVTVLLGQADTRARNLATGPAAMAQGPNRYQRGLNAFHMAQSAAQAHGWAFGWTLSEVPNVGHKAAAMFASPQAINAVTRSDNP